ncbi:hypothetical protein FQU71_07140 [Legionella longbeachae]|nr:hypothetical protein FQU71_07140 [Legionella longbeachae]
MSYLDALYPVEYAKALILLQKANALTQETLKYFKCSGLPHEFLSFLEKVNHVQQLNAESAKWIMTTCLGYHSETQHLAFIELNKAKIQFDVADLLSKEISGKILIIAKLNNLTQDECAGICFIKKSKKQPKAGTVSYIERCRYYGG